MSGTTQSAVARALAVLGVCALGLGAWWSIPRVSAEASRAPLDVALVDVSKSVVARAAGEWARQTGTTLEEWAEASRASGHDVALVAFGRDVRVAFPPQPARAFVASLRSLKLEPGRDMLERGAPLGALESNLAAALNLARSLASERRLASITILGDGTFTGPDPARTAHELAQDGTSVTVHREPARAWNLALGPLVCARELEAGAPIVVATALRVDRGTLPGARAARVEFELRDSGGVQRRTVSVDLRDLEFVPVHADLGPARAGALRIEAHVSFESRVPDAILEDDRSMTFARCGGSLVVGRLKGDSSAPPWTLAGLDFVDVDRDRLAAQLDVLDAVITEDVALGRDEQRLLASFVRRGGGWLDLAGWSWMRARMDTAEPLAGVAALVPDEDSARPRDVIFLIDASGSMAGEPFDAVRSRLSALVDLALPEDDVSVRFFAGEPFAPIRFGTSAQRSDPARRSALVEEVRASRSAGGPTRILHALETIAAERAGVERDTLVLLLSDGRDLEAREPAERFERLKRARAAARLRVAAVAPVADVEREYLKSIADSFVDLADPSLWPDVFARELVEREIVRRARTPVIAVVDGPEPAASLARSTGTPPAIDAFARTRVADGAQALWTDDHGSPLAAFVRRGGGRVVSLAFAPGTDWAPGFANANSLAPILRALARSERSRRPCLAIEDERIVLENVDADFPARARALIRVDDDADREVFLSAQARGIDDLKTRSAKLQPGLDAKGGIALVHVEGGASGDLDLALELPRAAEFALEPHRFVALTQGTAGNPPVGGRGAHPFAPWSLLLGVVALALSAFLGAFSASRQ